MRNIDTITHTFALHLGEFRIYIGKIAQVMNKTKELKKKKRTVQIIVKKLRYSWVTYN